MRGVFVFGVFLLSILSAQAQRTWWAGAGVEIAETQGLIGWAYSAGGGFAWNRFYAGGFVTQTASLLENEEAGNPYAVSLQLGGLTAAYHRPAAGPVEVTAGMRIGLGRAVRKWEMPGLPPDRDAIFTAVPFVGVEVVVAPPVRLSLCSGLRIFRGFNQIEPYTNQDLSALVNSLSIRVNFGRR